MSVETAPGIPEEEINSFTEQDENELTAAFAAVDFYEEEKEGRRSGGINGQKNIRTIPCLFLMTQTSKN